MDKNVKVFAVMIALQIPIGLIIDFVIMRGWGMSDEMLVIAWLSIILSNTVGYWGALSIINKLG